MTERDASRQEAARLELDRGSADPYAAAIQATRMPIAITDVRIEDHPIVFANDAFIQLSGYSRDEVIGRNCRFLQGPETDRAEVARIAAAIAAHESVTAEILNYRKDGSTFWNALYISPVFDAAGGVSHFFGSQLDVTARNRAAQELRDANAALACAKETAEAQVADRTRELEIALDQKTQLLHELDHRVKNNLQLISSLIQLQSRRISDPAVQATMKAMLGRVSAIATVHRSLLQVDGAAAFDVAAFVRAIAADLVEAAGREDVELAFDLSPVTAPAANAAPIALIVHELVDNAVRHGLARRPGRISLGLLPHEQGHRLEVSDDGVGMAPDARSGFGLGLVDLLARQLAARVERPATEAGHVVAVTLPGPDRSHRKGD